MASNVLKTGGKKKFYEMNMEMNETVFE